MPAWIGATEAVEGAWHELARGPCAFVADGEGDASVSRLGGEGDGTCAMPDRVVCQIRERLFKARSVTDYREVLSFVDNDRASQRACLGAVSACHAGEQFVGVEALRIKLDRSIRAAGK